MTTDEDERTRRGFVKGTAVAGAGLAMLGAAGAMTSALTDGWFGACRDFAEEYTAFTYHQSHLRRHVPAGVHGARRAHGVGSAEPLLRRPVQPSA